MRINKGLKKYLNKRVSIFICLTVVDIDQSSFRFPPGIMLQDLHLGVDIQAAKGGMFDDLESVAKHLQSIGGKIDAPSDPRMAQLLGKYGVLNNNKGVKMLDFSQDYFLDIYQLY